MAIADSGVAGLNQYPVNFLLMRQLLLAAKERAPFFAGTTPGQLTKNAGTASVRWERIENLTRITTPLTELTGALVLPTRTGVVPSITQLDATMVKYGNPIYITEELDLMSVNARSSKFMDTLGENAGASLNGLMETVFSGSVTAQTRLGNNVATNLLIITAIAANDIKFSHNLINRQGGQKFKADAFGSVNVGSSPVRNSYLGICHVDVEEDMRAIADFISVEQYGGYTETFPFEFGSSGGVRWLSTELDTMISADEATASAVGFRGTSDILNDVYDSYIFGMDSIGSVGLGENHTQDIYMSGDALAAVDVIHQPRGTSGVADVMDEIASIAWKAWFVGKILQTTPSITQLDATMVKYGNPIYITEELDLMSVNARSSKFMDTLGENAGASLNGLMETVFSGSVTAQTRLGNNVATNLLIITAIAANDIKFSHNLINRQGGQKFKADAFGSVNVGSSPVRNSYLGICHVDVEEDMRAIADFISVEQYGGYTETFPFEFGSSGGVRWLSTELDTMISADEATASAVGFRGTSDILNDVYDSYIFGMDSIGSVGLGENHTQEIYMSGDALAAVDVIHHPRGTSGVADVMDEIASIAWKAWFVGKILQNDWLVKVRTLATEL